MAKVKDTGEFKMKEEFIGGAIVPFEKVKIKWAYLDKDRPDTRFDSSGVWKLEIILDKAQADALKEVGFKVRQDSEGDWLLTCKRKVRTAKGVMLQPPTVVDKDGRTPFTGMIGNGTLANVYVKAEYKEVGGKTYLPAYLNKVQILKLIPFDGIEMKDYSGEEFDD
jgi:hypothetical protein